jgi:hypothetical protein
VDKHCAAVGSSLVNEFNAFLEKLVNVLLGRVVGMYQQVFDMLVKKRVAVIQGEEARALF